MAGGLVAGGEARVIADAGPGAVLSGVGLGGDALEVGGERGSQAVVTMVEAVLIAGAIGVPPDGTLAVGLGFHRYRACTWP